VRKPVAVSAILLAALASGVYFVAPLRLALIVLAGRSPVCPLSNALQAAENLRTQIAFKDEILRASKKLETDPAGFHLWDTPDGRYWVPEGSDYVLPFNLAEQKRQIYGAGERAVQSGDVVLDCGANVGVFTRSALRAGAKRVIAIEPAPENIECLRRNFTAEIATGRVVVYEKGVWDKDDFLTLQVDPHNSAADSFLIHRDGGVEGKKVPLTTIDKLVAELKIEKVGYIKMDIEGAEQRALAGARATLARDRPRLSLSAYHNDDDPVKVPEAVRRAWSGYSMECGPCAETRFRVRPDILYFR
jgi:FkbM family methyltransferase